MNVAKLRAPDRISGCANMPSLQMASSVTEPVPPLLPALGPQPLTVDAKALAVVLGGIGIRTVRAWDAAGVLPKPIRIGGRVVWLLDAIRAWLAAGAPSRAEWEARKRAEKGSRR